MDGVLLDSEPLYKEVQTRYFADLGFSVSDDEYDDFIGLGLEKMWKLIKSRRKIDLPISKLIKVNNKKIKAYFLKKTPFFVLIINSKEQSWLV